MSKEKNIDFKPGDIVYEVVLTPDSKKVPIHSWIHGGSDAQIIHAAAGRRYMVTQHNFATYTSHGTHIIVLRPQESKFAGLIAQIAKKWSPLLNEDEVLKKRELKIQENNSTKVNLSKELKRPATVYTDNRKPGSTIYQEANVFRAVRAALRSGIADGKTMPLSKIRGVSCNQFVSFNLQAAIVLFLLGNEVEQLRGLVNQIAEVGLKTATGLSSYHEHLRKLDKAFTALASRKAETLPKTMRLEDLLTAVRFPAKGCSINKSMPFWREAKLFEELEGELILIGDTMVINPTLIPVVIPAPASALAFGINSGEESASDEEDATEEEELFDGRKELFEEKEESGHGTHKANFFQLPPSFPSTQIRDDSQLGLSTAIRSLTRPRSKSMN